jgi:hypothetical protein
MVQDSPISYPSDLTGHTLPAFWEIDLTFACIIQTELFQLLHQMGVNFDTHTFSPQNVYFQAANNSKLIADR